MKNSLRLKSLTLLFLLAVSIFPFKLFCNTSDKEVSKTLAYNPESSHHDCPFCSFQFFHEFEQTSDSSISIAENFVKDLVFQFEKHTVSFSNLTQNKGPPTSLL